LAIVAFIRLPASPTPLLFYSFAPLFPKIEKEKKRERERERKRKREKEGERKKEKKI
jgi:hypothetical protein